MLSIAFVLLGKPFMQEIAAPSQGQFLQVIARKRGTSDEAISNGQDGKGRRRLLLPRNDSPNEEVAYKSEINGAICGHAPQIVTLENF